MLIGELAKKTELSKDTIRFYQKIGLIRHIGRQSSQNNYKQYDSTTVERLKLIKRAKELGFTLNEIAMAIDAWQGNKLSKTEKIQIFQNKIVDIDRRIDNLNQIKAYLQSKLDLLD
jgi:MerR family transcriptional regulator, copper efflux regulator